MSNNKRGGFRGGYGRGKPSPHVSPVSKPVSNSVTASKVVAKPTSSSALPASSPSSIPAGPVKNAWFPSLNVPEVPKEPRTSVKKNAEKLSFLDEQIKRSKQELEALDNYLEEHELVRVDIAKDGACLFRSMAQGVFGVQGMHMKVRQACVEHLLKNEDLFVHFIDVRCDIDDKDAVHQEYIEYTDKLRGETAWGGQVEIQALSQCYETNFIIYQALPLQNDDSNISNDDSKTKEEQEVKYEIITTEISNGFQKSISLAYSHGNHYDIILTRNQIIDMIYIQKLFDHMIDCLWENKEEREKTWFCELSFEKEPETPISTKEIKQMYHNKHWKRWCNRLHLEKQSDESLARSLSVDVQVEENTNDEGWQTVGSKKKKNKNLENNTNTQSNHQNHQQHYNNKIKNDQQEIDRQMANRLSMEENPLMAVEYGLEIDIKQQEEILRRIEEDERIAREIADEQLALQLSQELNDMSSNTKENNNKNNNQSKSNSRFNQGAKKSSNNAKNQHNKTSPNKPNHQGKNNSNRSNQLKQPNMNEAAGGSCHNAAKVSSKSQNHSSSSSLVHPHDHPSTDNSSLITSDDYISDVNMSVSEVIFQQDLNLNDDSSWPSISTSSPNKQTSSATTTTTDGHSLPIEKNEIDITDQPSQETPKQPLIESENQQSTHSDVSKQPETQNTERPSYVPFNDHPKPKHRNSRQPIQYKPKSTTSHSNQPVQHQPQQ